MEKDAQTLPKVKRWVSQSVAPMLAVICAADLVGQHGWRKKLSRPVNAGKHRIGVWRTKTSRSVLIKSPAGTRAHHFRGVGGVVRLPLL